VDLVQSFLHEIGLKLTKKIL